VIDVLLENKIEFDGGAGISAGAVFGSNYKSRQPGRALRYNKKYASDPRYCSLRSLLKTGNLYGVDFCYHELPDVLDPFDREAFAQNPMEFYVGATDLRTGKIVYHKCADGGARDIEWLQASASMPLVSRPVSIGKYTLLDGGIVEPVPLHFMERIGYDRNVVILTQPKSYIKKKNKAMPMLRVVLRDYPAAVKALDIRHKRYNRLISEIAAQEKAGQLFVIRPPKSLGIRRTETDPKELERVYRIGRAAANERLSELKAFLETES